MDEHTAVKLENVYKNFRLPHEKSSTLKGAFTNLLKGKTNRSYETQHALKDISFEIKKGEFFGIVGRNGSGKSTLLKILAGIYQPTKGKVHTKGRIVPFIELGVGFNAELTGRENVFLNGSLLGFSRSEITEKYDAIVEFAELKRFMDQILKNYSSGMQVRLAFSVATILAESDILLIDEVLAVGDASFQRKCYDYFSNLKKLNKTVVFVSHDMNAVREYCDRAVLIDNSELIHEGTASEIATHYTRMFNEDGSKNNAHSDDKNVWGDQKAIFTKVSAKPKTLTEQDKELVIITTIRGNELVEGPIAGIMIKNATGNPIMGTNTKLEKKDILQLEKDQSVTLQWSIPNILSDGTYYIDVALTYEDGIGVLEWREDAIRLEVFRDIHLPFAIAPEFTITRVD